MWFHIFIGKSVDRRTQETFKDDPDYEMIDDSNVQTGESIATRSSYTQPATYTQLELYLTLIANANSET